MPSESLTNEGIVFVYLLFAEDRTQKERVAELAGWAIGTCRGSSRKAAALIGMIQTKLVRHLNEQAAHEGVLTAEELAKIIARYAQETQICILALEYLARYYKR
ncbi:MAG: hypothetical protein UZ21_OP11001000354 [Microgenomates bacterium OLB22]|nr:MAG: hypothetical protein UZ21_OP11001000354 [Microgenomates bacterium OLB22]